MKYITDSNGKKISVSYFGNLQDKIDTATGYIQMYNQMAADKNAPQVDVDYAVKKIRKAHTKYYGEDTRYKGDGSLRG